MASVSSSDENDVNMADYSVHCPHQKTVILMRMIVKDLINALREKPLSFPEIFSLVHAQSCGGCKQFVLMVIRKLEDLIIPSEASLPTTDLPFIPLVVGVGME
ncbi:hypothetical protein CEXT_41 [Caerostris extrusa]|uniref:Uncharacterized protein n=1 Tax=Caerostris extrusa TaxID=172846 RepID=A0AAV4WLK0_CAEEX|nr:hypothetical protein CEXT_41 [Caerostris extrusa]